MANYVETMALSLHSLLRKFVLLAFKMPVIVSIFVPQRDLNHPFIHGHSRHYGSQESVTSS